MPAFEVDLIDPATDLPTGFGPLLTVQFWDDEDQLDSSGEVSLDAPRADYKTDLLDERMKVRCSTLRDGQWTVVGSGIIDTLTEDIQPDQPLLLEVGANGPGIALADRTVGSLRLSIGTTGENPMLAADLLPAIMAYAPAGFTVIGTPSEDVYLAFSGETVLAALNKLAQQLGDHYRFEWDPVIGNILRWLPKSTAPVASGMRAMGNIPNPRAMDSTTCLITHFNRKRDSSKRVTRVEAFGGGNNKARVTLKDATYTLPAGYSYEDETVGGVHRYWIKHTALDAAGRIDAEKTFDDVVEIDVTSGHRTSAKNALAQTAVVWLARHTTTYFSYDIEVAGLQQVVRSGQTIRTIYDDFTSGRRIPMADADLVVLGVKKRLDADSEERIVGFTLASSDRWPEDDDTLITAGVLRAHSQSAHLQVAYRAENADTAGTSGGVDGTVVNQSGPTVNRPSSPATGQEYIDTDLGIPIWWIGAQWVDGGGTAV